jgi:hypothetical protein
VDHTRYSRLSHRPDAVARHLSSFRVNSPNRVVLYFPYTCSPLTCGHCQLEDYICTFPGRSVSMRNSFSNTNRGSDSFSHPAFHSRRCRPRTGYKEYVILLRLAGVPSFSRLERLDKPELRARKPGSGVATVLYVAQHSEEYALFLCNLTRG